MEKDELGFIYVHSQLLAKREGDYTAYVFKILDESQRKYIVCTKCPNWNQDDLHISQEGYLKYKPVIAYKDTWTTKEFVEMPYKYSANYFYDFIPITHVIQGNQIIGKELIIT